MSLNSHSSEKHWRLVLCYNNRLIHLSNTTIMKTEIEKIFEIYDTERDSYVGLIDFQDNEGELYDFEIFKTKSFLAFGHHWCAGFRIFGFIERESHESVDETVQKLLEDLKVYYNDGPEYVSRIKCTYRM